MTDLITDLSPRFKAPYLFSAVMLSIFTGDKKGADRILQKGLRQFPKDWRLLFYSTYFYSMEVKQWDKAVDYAHQSAKNGGPQWLYGFANPQAGSQAITSSSDPFLSSKKAQQQVWQVSETLRQDLLKRKLTKEQKQYIKQKWQKNKRPLR